MTTDTILKALGQYLTAHSDWNELQLRGILLAVSGGRDSMALWEALAILKIVPLGIAHVNHNLNPESAAIAVALKKRALRLGHPYFETQIKWESEPGTVKSNAVISEERLRTYRWSFLKRTCHLHHYAAVATAHHAQDQLETILMRYLRGPSLHGLTGIPSSRQILRPLLGVTPSELEEFCLAHNIPRYDDPSNSQRLFLRNRIRQDILPHLVRESQAFGGPDRFLRRIVTFTHDLEKLEAQTHRQFTQLAQRIVVATPWWLRLQDNELGAHLNLSEAAAFLRFLANTSLRVKLLRRDESKIEAALTQKAKHLELRSGLGLRYSLGYWYLALHASKAFSPTFKAPTLADCGVTLDNASVPQPYVLRFFERGDRWQGGKKLKAFFYEWGIPEPERHALPLLVAPQNHVLAIPSHGLGTLPPGTLVHFREDAPVWKLYGAKQNTATRTELP